MVMRATSAEARFRMWIAECRRLRNASNEAEVDFLAFVSTGEDDEEMWRYAGHPTFFALVKAENVCHVDRLNTFRREVARFGFDLVRAHGVDQIREVMKIPDDAVSKADPEKLAVNAVIADLDEFRSRHGVSASKWQAENTRKRHYVPAPKLADDEPDDEPDDKQAARIAQLEAENNALRRENAKLKSENAELRVEVERLGGGKPPGGSRSPKKTR